MKISDAELEVMEVIWKMKETTSVEIISELRFCHWNDNTIRTLIKRLNKKKAVGILKKEGKTYKYIPLIDKKVYRRERTKKFIEQFYHNSVCDIVLELVEENQLTKEELQEIRKIIEKKMK